MKRTYLLASLLVLSYSCWSQTPFSTKEFIDINDIKAQHMVHGDMWWDPATGEARCEYPKGSGKHASFLGSIWMGGFDQQAQLHVSAQTYRQTGNDYWPGPLDNNGSIDYSTSEKWAKIWKVNRTTIDSFKTLSTHTVANTPASILTWPGKGNPNAKGNNNAMLQITGDMAPFKDVNNDGVYNPLDGDYPNIKGDQMLWWIFNDNGPSHNASGGAVGLQFEIRTSAYAYRAAGMLSSTVYYEFELKNRSAQKYDSLVLGLFSDADLGYAFDDFVGFDSAHRMGISYNSTPYDGSGQTNSYGLSVPVTGVSLVELPGDSYPATIVPAGSFMQPTVDFSAIGFPANGGEYYNYLNHTFKDGTPLVYGPTATSLNHCLGYGSGTPAKYVYPGDPGTSTGWNECNCSNLGGDRRFVIATNPVTINVNETKKIGMALLIQPNAGGGCNNFYFTSIKNMADSTWWYYNHPPIPPTSVGQLAISQNTLKLYPNPANNSIFIERSAGNSSDETVLVYDAIGRKMNISTAAKNNSIEVSLSQLTPGIYTVIYRNATGSQTNIFVKE